jgi:arylsulfatase A-like enzyme
MGADLESPPMRRWLALGGAFLVGLLAVGLLRQGPSRDPGSQGSTPASGAHRPNVIIYLVDTLRADHLGVYGYHRDTSPVLDRWAAGGVIFDRAYAPSSWTKPSVVSLLSGLDPVSHGAEDRLDVIPPGVRMLSERLKSSGYATFAAVTNPQVLPQWGFDRGFDVYDDLDSPGHGTRADTVSDYTVERMGVLARSQPFFLYLHLLDPHAPYDPPAPFDTRFPKSPVLPAQLSIGQYDGEIAFVDSQFGRVLDSLRTHGLDGDTMTIFVADHGEELLDHGTIGHGVNLFEEVVRVPLVIRFPAGAHAGTRVGARASLTDVVPTVLSVLGQSLPPDMDGRDLTQLLNGNPPAWVNRDLFLSLRTTGPSSHLVRGVLGGSHKYLRLLRPIASESLYDLERDPAETDNLAGVQTDSRMRLAATLDAYLSTKSSGIHLRIVNDFARDPVGCEVRLHTTGRFIDVSGVRLEAGDSFELSDDGQGLRLDCRLENRHQSARAGPRLVPDEDGLVFLVSPPDAPIAVQILRLADGRVFPLRAGRHRGLEAVPFTFDATDAAWSIRDVGELLGDAGSVLEDAVAGAYLGVIRAPTKRGDIPKELLDRMRSLGYITG